MQSFQKSVTTWATLLGAIVSFIGLIQSRTWLAGIGTLCLLASIATGIYARRERLVLRSASVRVDDQSIDSLNIANLRRRVSTGLVVQQADHTAIIEGENLKLMWRYSGYCLTERETAIEFSIDSDNFIPFEELDCFAYDLLSDPGKNHKIRPILIGADGISKKIAVPFPEPLLERQPFGILLKCSLPGCLRSETEYLTSTLSFDQESIHEHSIRLIFIGDRPRWVRAYDATGKQGPQLLKDLKPLFSDSARSEYLDSSPEATAQSQRIYVFRRPRSERP